MTQQLINALSLGGIYALFAVGYALEFGILHVFNIAHAPLYMVAAILMYVLGSAGWPVIAAVTVPILVVGLLGILIERVAVRPLRRRGAGILPIFVATIGLGTIFAIGTQIWFGGNIRYLPEALSTDATWSFGGATVPVMSATAFALSIVAFGVLAMILRATRLGRAMRAVAEDPENAERVGVSTDQMYTVVFFVSSLLAGIAGVVGAAISDTVYTGMHLPLELRGFAVIVLGGLGSVPGAAVGAFLLAFAEVAAVILGTSFMREIVPFAVLFAVLVVRPRGLFGRRFREV